MQVDYQSRDNLNATITVTISREDYEAKYKTALQDYRKKANLKGFRKGKIPVGYLEKLFGQEVLTRTISDLLTDGVNHYLKDQDIPYIGQPLPAKNQEPLAIDAKDPQDEYTYTFDIGLLPEFEVKGIDEEIEWYDVAVTQEEIDKEWEGLLERHGTYIDTEQIEPDSRVQMQFREIENGAPKADAEEHTKLIHMSMLEDDIKAQLNGKKVGETIQFNPGHFLKDGSTEIFKKYYLDIKDDTPIADLIAGEVLAITKLQPAEADEEFFDTAFEPGTVKSKEEALEFIASALKQRNDAQSDAHLRHMLDHRLMDENKIELPLEFLDRLTRAEEDEHEEDQEESSEDEGDASDTVQSFEEITEEDAGTPAGDAADALLTEAEQEMPPVDVSGKQLEKSDATEDRPSSAKAMEDRANGFRWHFIRDNLTHKFNIEVSQDEIVRAAADHVYDRFGAYLPYDRMREIISRYLADKDSVAQLRNTVAETKLFYALKEHMPVVKKEISREEFAQMQHAHTHEH